MNYIVLDLEWNQSNTGKEKEVNVLPFEIIEIGAIKLSNDYRMVGEFSELVRPQVYHEMHNITSKLIHMQIEELQRGKPFVEVMERFLTWCGEEDYMFCTWGPLDLTELQRNMEFYKMEPLSLGPIPFLDVQKLFSIAYEDRKSRRALEYAIDFLKIGKDIPFHRAFSDAYYTAKVLAEIKDVNILKYISYDIYHPPQKREDEIKIQFDTYMKYISREFSDKGEAFADREVVSSKCYFCRRNLRKKVKWFSANGRHYYCVAFCEEHGFLKGKIRFRRTDEGKVYVVKTTKFISKQEADRIIERKGQVQKIKKEKNKIQNKKKIRDCD